MINVIVSEAFPGQGAPELLERAAGAALVQQQTDPDCDLSIVIEDDAHLQSLNNAYLGIDAPTDVLSFPSGEENVDPETGRVYLGDIIISLPRAAEQAAAAGHGVAEELQLLVVHGVLHLLGHDHAEPEEKAAMWSAQAEILRGLDVHLARLPE